MSDAVAPSFAAPVTSPLAARAARRATLPDATEARVRADRRLWLVIAAFAVAYLGLGARMAALSLSEPEPRTRVETAAPAPRGEITDRHGRLLATELPAFSLYARPREVLDPRATARALAGIFPNLDEARTRERLASGRRFVWIERPVTPRQRDRAMDIGEPGLAFGERAMRFYPAGRTAAHIVGDVRPGEEAVGWAEMVGTAGVERRFDDILSDPERSAEPLALSIDLALQHALTEVLRAEMARLDASGAAGVLLDSRTSEVLALVSLPDFDANDPRGAGDDRRGRSPRFNRAVQGVYELGSVFKPLTAAMALDAGVVRVDEEIATGDPIYVGRNRVRDFHRMPDTMTTADIIRRSSNVGSARLALRVTTPRFRDYLDRLGLFSVLDLELSEAAQARPLLPGRWTELSTMNIAFGHGLAVSPMHLASAYATLANGGRRVSPTLVKGGRAPGERVFSEAVAKEVIRMMRGVVSDGSGVRAQVAYYDIAGKTGTADKPREDGRGYHRDRVIASFGAVFPANDPAYVLVVSMDEPTDRSGRWPNRQASRTAAPAVALAIRRLAPILGLRPRPPLSPEEGRLPAARPW
ncbi:MAG: peptidoglycan D,D-transpeptidase FtsI family protein [Paracoccaceae bacterium]